MAADIEAFFDLAEFLPDAEVRAAYVDLDTLLTGGDASDEPPRKRSHKVGQVASPHSQPIPNRWLRA